MEADVTGSSFTMPDGTERRSVGRRRSDAWPQPRVSVVIPAMNEALNLPHVLPRVPTWVHEILLVDGFSKDNTVAVAQQLRSDLRVVTQEGKGKGAALRSGFAAASGDIIVMLDADGSMDPAEIPFYVGALVAGADFVKGSRFLHGAGTVDMELYRKLGNQAFVIMVRMLFGGRFSDLCYGYNAFWRRVLPQLALDADGFEVETLMNVRALQAGLKIVEVSSFEARRINGVSNLQTFPDGMRVLKTILRERFNERPAIVVTAVAERLTAVEVPTIPILAPMTPVDLTAYSASVFSQQPEVTHTLISPLMESTTMKDPRS